MKTHHSAYRHAAGVHPFLFILILLFLSMPFSIRAQKNNAHHPALKSKQYMRSEWFTSSRTDSSGSMGNYLKALNSFRDKSGGREIPGNYQSAQWYPLGPFKTTHPVLAQLGLVSSIWIDTSDFQTIYAGSNTGGIFRTTDGGDNWSSLSDNYLTTGVLSIQVDPQHKERIFIGTGHLGFGRAYGYGVMKSNDGGITWEQTGLNSHTLTSNFTVRRIALLPQQPDALLALVNTEFRLKGYIYRSADGAQTWEEVYTDDGAELFSIKSDPVNPDVIYATGNRFLKSTDAGLHWIDLSTSLPLDTNYVFSRVEVAKSSHNSDLLYVMAEVYDTTGFNLSARLDLFKSVDGGETYSKINLEYNPLAGYWKLEFAISPAHDDEFYLGGVWLYKYRIEGDSAKYIYCSDHKYHHDVRDLHIFSGYEKDLMYMANDGGVSKSETGAESWQDITRNGLNITQFHNIAIGENSDFMYAGPQDANLSFYNFETGIWTKNAKVADAYEAAIDHQNPDIVYMITVPPKVTRPHIFILKSTNAGGFFDYYGIPDSTEVGRNDKPLAMDPVEPGTLYVGVRNVWKTTDGAVSWEKISDFSAVGEQKLISLRIAPSNNKVIIAAFENPNWGMPDPAKLWITPDGGNHWLNITPTGTLSVDYAGISDITFHPEMPQKFWLSLDREWENHRVYMTADGGATWQNYSEGLPALPVNTITYVSGAGYDVLLAATDAGVYYRDEQMSGWERFGNGLPYTIVADIKISYSRRKIIAGTFGRGLWEADLCMPLTEGELAISDTVEWSGKRKVLQDVVINPGGKLIVRSVAEMGLDRKIKVMPGAELLIDRGTLTNDCAGMWDGIRLYGSADYDNPTLPQGKLTLLHGGSVLFADTAVKTIAIDGQGSLVSGSGGGIIYANNAKFINNTFGIEINASEGKNPSVFSLCQFATNKQLPNGSIAGDLVSLKGSHGVRFTSCQFENNLPLSGLPYHSRGIGINSFNSTFLVEKLPSLDSVPFGLNADAVFRQLWSGIKATSSSPAFSTDISNVNFDRNLTGIYIAGMSLCRINSCNFNLSSPNVNDTLKPAATAIYMDQCSYFDISSNVIRGPLGAIVPKSKSAGMIFNRCGMLNNTVYGNSITFTNYAMVAQNSNRSTDGFSGLRILYNWFDGNEYDICLTNDSTSPNNGIALHQGASGNYPAVPAGNRFSYSKWHRDADVHNAGEMLYYHYFSETDSTNLKPVNQYRIYPVTVGQSYPADSVYRPDYLLTEGTGIENEFNHFNDLYEGLDHSFKDKLDGGNTGNLISEISHCAPDQVTDLISGLASLSPFLSSETLIALIENQKTIPNTLIFDILAGNNHFVRSKEVMEAIGQMKPPLKDYMLASLAPAYTQYSLLELAESELNAARAARDLLFIKRSQQMPDTINDGLDQIIPFLLNDDRPESHYLASFMNAAKGKKDEAEFILSGIPAKFPQLDQDMHNQRTELLGINLRLFPEGKIRSSLDQAESDLLSQLKPGAETGIYAYSTLNYYNQGGYSEPYIFPGVPGVIKPPVVPPVQFSGAGFGVFPVPAKDYVILDYFSEYGLINGKLRITSVSGQIVRELIIDKSYGQQIIDISQLDAGTYLFMLMHDGGKIGEQKVIIVR
ncbi:MAG: T9SS type A sorting domain-containing protein [Bacteroidota bacterium]